jgi:hypothetical protein
MKNRVTSITATSPYSSNDPIDSFVQDLTNEFSFLRHPFRNTSSWERLNEEEAESTVKQANCQFAYVENLLCFRLF